MSELRDDSTYSRGIAFVVAVFSIAAFLSGSLLLGMYYGFSTLAGEPYPEPERTRRISREFLFHEGPTQIVLIFVFALHGFGGLVAAIVHAAAAVFRVPTKPVAIRLTIAGGVLGSVLFVGYFVRQSL